MIIPRGKAVVTDLRTTVGDVLSKLKGDGFTGYVKMAYRGGELSVAHIVCKHGKIVLCDIEKLISKIEVRGDDAMNDILNFTDVPCVVSMYKLDVDVVNQIIPLKARSIVRKGKRMSESKPSLTEPSSIEKTLSDDVRSKAKEIVRSYLGDMLSKKIVKVIDETTDIGELSERIRKASKPLVTFVPKKKINKMIEDVENLFAQ
jgi:hypothetical protein